MDLEQLSQRHLSRQKLEETLLGFLDNAVGMHLGLSEDDTAYDLKFIGEKLSKVSKFIEDLSDLQIHTTKLTLEVTKQYSAAKNLLKLKTDEAHESFNQEEKGNRYERDSYVRKLTAGVQHELNEWEGLRAVARQIAEALSSRAADMKRLDSDIRLQKALLEAKISSGATSPTGREGKDAQEMDLG